MISNTEHIKGGFLEIELGPMFSGKSISGLRRLVTYHDIGFKCLFINSHLDDREVSSTNTIISTHHSGGINLPSTLHQLKVKNLSDIDVLEYNMIHIDEAQFFNDLDIVRIWVDEYKKVVSISGLDGDYKRNVFNQQLLNLIPFADVVTKKRSYCQSCLKDHNITYAPFTKRNVVSTEVILPGGADLYSPSCRSCYLLGMRKEGEK
jgi:thymidine kinase